MFLQMSHESDTERVASIEPLLLHQEVHGLRQALVVAHPEGLHAAGLAQPGLYLLGELTSLLLGAGMVLEVLDVLDGHLDDLSLLDPAPTLLEVGAGDEPAEVRQAVVHPVSPSLLYNSVRHGVLYKDNVMNS